MPFEVDAYINPTHLFTCIDNGEIISAVSRALDFPNEVETWIVSRTRHSSRDEVVEVKWKYLPLHLACLQSNPSHELIVTLLQVHPQGAKVRDYHGHLPFHYLLSEGSENLNTVKAVFNANRKALLKSNGSGMSPQEIVQKNVSMRSKERLEKWLAQELENIAQSHDEGVGERLEGTLLDPIRTSNIFFNDSGTHLIEDKFDMSGSKELRKRIENRTNFYDQKASFLESESFKVNDDHFHNISIQQSQVTLPSCLYCQALTKELDSLKKDVKLDAEIVSRQDDRIQELESDLQSCGKEAHSNKEEISLLKHIVAVTEEKLKHAKEVTTIFQNIITNKDKDLKLLHERLQNLSDRQQSEGAGTYDYSHAGEKLERLFDDLLSLVTRLSIRVDRSSKICDEYNGIINQNNQKQSPNFTETKICSLDKVNNLRSQLCLIEKCIGSISQELRDSREENLSLLRENRCRDETVKDQSTSSTASPTEIKDRQLCLLNEPKENHEQIKGAISIAWWERTDSTSFRSNLGIHLKPHEEGGNELLEDFRPWRRQQRHRDVVEHNRNPLP